MLIKESAIIGTCAIALCALFDRTISFKKRVNDILILSIPSVAAFFLITTLTDSIPITSNSYGIKYIINTVLEGIAVDYKVYMSYVPELALIFVVSIFLALFFISRTIYHPTINNEVSDKVIIFNSLLIIMFLIFHFIVCTYFQTNYFHVLLRYFIFIIPSIFFIIFFSLNGLIKKDEFKRIILVFIISINIINRGGFFYPEIPFTNNPTAERSEEYIKGYYLQKEYIKTLEKKVPPEVHIYTNLSDYFMTHYAASGYVQKPLNNVYYIKNMLKEKDNNFILPDHFVLAHYYSSLGGEIIINIIKTLTKHDTYNIKVLAHFVNGKSEAYILELKKRI